MNEIRQKIVDYAIAQTGKPYANHGWGPHAWDCIGLTVTAGVQAGAFEYDLKEEEDLEIRNYSCRPNPPLMKRVLQKHFIRITKSELFKALPGDFLWFRDPKAQHLGIITRINPFYCVHAQLPWPSKVRHHRISQPAYIVCGWRFPELADG